MRAVGGCYTVVKLPCRPRAWVPWGGTRPNGLPHAMCLMWYGAGAPTCGHGWARPRERVSWPPCPVEKQPSEASGDACVRTGREQAAERCGGFKGVVSVQHRRRQHACRTQHTKHVRPIEFNPKYPTPKPAKYDHSGGEQWPSTKRRLQHLADCTCSWADRQDHHLIGTCTATLPSRHRHGASGHHPHAGVIFPGPSVVLAPLKRRVDRS